MDLEAEVKARRMDEAEDQTSKMVEMKTELALERQKKVVSPLALVVFMARSIAGC